MLNLDELASSCCMCTVYTLYHRFLDISDHLTISYFDDPDDIFLLYLTYIFFIKEKVWTSLIV